MMRIGSGSRQPRIPIPTCSPQNILESERRALVEHDFNREYLGIPGGGRISPFTWDLFERATDPDRRRATRFSVYPAGRAVGRTVDESIQRSATGRRRPMITFNRHDPSTWP